MFSEIIARLISEIKEPLAKIKDLDTEFNEIDLET